MSRDMISQSDITVVEIWVPAASEKCNRLSHNQIASPISALSPYFVYCEDIFALANTNGFPKAKTLKFADRNIKILSLKRATFGQQRRRG